MTTTRRPLARCTFCRKANTDVGTLVAGSGVFICDEGVALCSALIAGRLADSPSLAPWELDLSQEDVLTNLTQVALAGADLQASLAAWVARARSLAATWAQIGDALGMTRQSAWERFAD